MKRHLVHLTLPIDAEDPKEAVKGFIDKMTEHGLRTWVYSVVDIEDPEDFQGVSYITGYGQEVKEDPIVEDEVESATPEVTDGA